MEAVLDKKTKFNIWYLLFALWGVLIIHGLWMRATQIQEIPYSQFQTYLAANRIEEIRISSNYIQGTLKDPKEGEVKSFRTVRVDPDLAKILGESKVKFVGEIESTFLSDLLSWVVPVLLFVGVWMFLMRRFAEKQGLGGGFMAIGKSPGESRRLPA
jgi:cell division protease FtsH